MVLPGVARKLCTAFLLLSLAGWITFGVGFGLRNFEYSKHEALPRATLYPDFTILWVFGISFPVLFVLTVVDLFCAYRVTTSLALLILPVYLVSAGGVLFLNGHYIYQYYQVDSSQFNQSSAVSLSDLGLRMVVADASLVSPGLSLSPLITDLDIHGDDKYVSIEFAGAVSTVFFTWMYLVVSPFFSPRKDYDIIYN